MYGRDIMEKDVAIYIYVVGLKLVGAHLMLISAKNCNPELTRAILFRSIFNYYFLSFFLFLG